MASDEAEVLAANAAFYAAFARRDLVAMDDLWARHAGVACVHPGWDVVRGRAEVMASFRAILSSPSAPAIVAKRPAATVLGDAAFVVCTESIDGNELVATNLFVREDGAFRLVLHQAGPIARREALKRTPPKVLN
ncbi:nuclear transport factor 2 family protein [Polyangium jinanense]|uniref:Nuclear transport factor 2 family protein n=1 Tax=Polyangium jinanense TaxID=2829994 RepID=A0A9X3X1G2_9BACT|nr:nuclear transport factor 2 family protein [Polyangium jinanense]MDC3954055.1 nuclear transport factor 2 family protein [Polyangium jinanense]MDC3981989.1 nuclear transport factor 2 family protein [Polyangium jinanense]